MLTTFMGQKSFVHLHVHSDYSLLDGSCRLDRLMSRVHSLGMPAVAITDHGNLFGVPEFVEQAEKQKVKGIIGCEVYLAWDHKHFEKPRRNDLKMYHLTLLAMNQIGYKNLSQLVSIAHTKGFYYKPRVDKDLLSEYQEGIIALSGCMSGLPSQFLIEGSKEKALDSVAQLKDIFDKDRLFVEIQNHGMEEQKMLVPELLKIAKDLNLQTVATNDAHYISKQDWEAHDSLLCIQTGAKLSDENRMRFSNQEFYIKSRDEMAEFLPGCEDALDNTILIAEMCNAKLIYGKNCYPVFEMDDSLKIKFDSNISYLKSLCKDGLTKRYPDVFTLENSEEQKKGQKKSHKERNSAKKTGDSDFGSKIDILDKTILEERLDYEMSVIEKMGFVDYFLIVWDFVYWAKKNKIPVGPGRGSVAGSIVSYILGITDIDPLRFGLLFERFLNPERVSPPDIDIDFCMRRRDEVIQYVRQKYGVECVANIVTFGTFGAKMVMRDLARVNDLPYSEGDRFAKMVPEDLGITLEESAEKSGEMKEELARNPLFRRIFEQGKTIEGTVRNIGTHAAGILISNGPLTNWIPVTLQDGMLTTQYSKDPVESLGLLKMDFLGLKILTVIADAEANIRRSNPNFDMEKIPLEDKNTFDLLNTGKTAGVFQLESPGIQSLCRQFEINSIDEISAVIALYRPGPMELIGDYIQGKKNSKTIRYVHPLLADICKNTYGIMIYQEQVMETARVIGGYTLGGADILRRAMGKKKVEVMNAQREIFVKGAFDSHGIERSIAEEIFDLLEKFAGYGFNKSHSDAYAMITYRTAYLKANFGVYFMAAFLSTELGNADKISYFVNECKRMNICVLGPDINTSLSYFTPIGNFEDKQNNGKIVFGLSAIKGVGDVAAKNIISERELNGQYKDFFDFLIRIDLRVVNKRVLECLIKTGAFDCLGYDRSSLLDGLDLSIQRAAVEQKDRERGQTSLFDLGSESTSVATDHNRFIANSSVMSLQDKLKNEKELLGFYLSGHPMDEYAGFEKQINCSKKGQFRICGVISNVVKRLSKRTNLPWISMTIYGSNEQWTVNVYSNVLESCEDILIDGNVVIVEGTVRKGRDNDELRMSVMKVNLIKKALPSLIQSYFWIVYPNEIGLEFLKLLAKYAHSNIGNSELKVGFYIDKNYALEGSVASSFKCYFPPKILQLLRSNPAVFALEISISKPKEFEKKKFGYH